MKVYLAGPITGQSYDGCVNWREDVKVALEAVGIAGYSPMRGKAYLSQEEKIQDSYSDFTMSSINGINVRDYNDVKTADAILVNFLDCGTRVSIGTVMEIAWARVMQIPIVIVMEKGNVHDHGMLTFGNIVVSTLHEGISAIRQILLP
jgi:nucleoside 2-deoxyribosyltransferase